MLHSATPRTETAPLSLVIMDRQLLTRDFLARLLGQALGLAVVGCCDTVAALERIVAQRHPGLALVALHAEENLEAAVVPLAARLGQTRLLLLVDRWSADLERRAIQSGALGCLSKEQSLLGLEVDLRRIGAGQSLCAGHDGAQLSAGELVPSTINFASASEFKPGLLGQLTRREIDVLLHIAQGYTVKQCAEALGISPSTVDNHKSRLMRKLRVHKTVDLARLAMQCGLSRDAGTPQIAWAPSAARQNGLPPGRPQLGKSQPGNSQPGSSQPADANGNHASALGRLGQADS